MPSIRPNRDNWEQFCEEPKLTAEEWHEWQRLAAIVGEDDALLTEYINAVPKPEPAEPTADWSDFVANADAHRRFIREATAWMREHVEEEELFTNALRR